MRNPIARRILVIAVGAALLVEGRAAHAAAFALLEQSASRLGVAFAGTAAAAEDASVLYFNPAGLAHLQGTQAAVLASAIEITSEFRDRGSLAAFAQPLGGDGGDAGGWNFVPAAYLSVPVNDRLTLGMGINAPFGLQLEYDDGWIGRFQALNSELETMNFNPTVAYRINPRVSIGLGVSYQRIQAELTNAVNYSAVLAQGFQQLVAGGLLSPANVPALLAANAGLEGDARVRGDDSSWGFNIGLMFDISAATRIGVSYRSNIDYTVKGSAAFDAPTAAEPVGAQIMAAASGPGGRLADGPVSLALEMPDTALLSLQQKLGDRFELVADVAWTGWSSIQELRIVRDTGTTLSVTPEHWSDAWRFALGATYTVQPQLALRAGVAFDETPVPDSTRTPRLPDGDRKWLTAGARWSPSPSWILDFGYAHVFNQTVPLSQDAGNASANGVLIGEQESDIDIVGVQVSYEF